MTQNIIIPDPEKLEKIKKAMTKDGAKRLHILADFDKTLTKAFVGGKSIVSLIAILRDGNYLTPDYAGKAHALYDKYHAIEIDLEIPFAEKKEKMHEWWSTHFELMIRSGLNKRDIKKAVESGKVGLRGGFREFAELLYARGIPLVILSASGMGTEAISIYLEESGRSYGNIYIVSNSFQWDKDGSAIRVVQPVIHSLNKSESMIWNLPFFEKIKNRKNVILLGDSTEDANMAQGFDFENLIKIGFLNENIGENLEKYKENFDIVILNDQPLDYVNQLLKEIILEA